MYIRVCVCVSMRVAEQSRTHHHFIIDLPRGHVFHSHGHGRDPNAAVVAVSRGIRHVVVVAVARRRWDEIQLGTQPR